MDALKIIEEAIEAQRQMHQRAKAIDPTYEESDFNRGYYVALIDMKLRLLHPID